MNPYETGYEGDGVDLQKLDDAKNNLVKADAYTRLYNTNSWEVVGYNGLRTYDKYGNRLYNEYGNKVDLDDRTYTTDLAALEKNLLPNIYKESYPIAGYWRDYELVKKYIGQQTLLEKEKISKQRNKLITKIAHQYDLPNNPSPVQQPLFSVKNNTSIGNLSSPEKYSSLVQLSSLSESISIILSYRCGMPFIQTYETRNHIPPPPSGIYSNYLKISDDPKTFVDLPDFSMRAQDLLVFAMSEGRSSATSQYKIEWNEWSDVVDQQDPYADRFHILNTIYGNKSMDILRRDIYSAHPICMVLHEIASPYVLADMVRQSNPIIRMKMLHKLINDVQDIVKVPLAQLEEDLPLEVNSINPFAYSYPWGKYRPLVIMSSHKIHNSNSKELLFLCENAILPDMFGDGALAKFDYWLFYGMLMLSLVALPTGALLTQGFIYVIRLFGVLSVGSAAYKVFDAFKLAPEEQSRENMLALLDEEIIAYENNTSRLSSLGGFLLELFFELPSINVKNIFKRTSKPPTKKVVNNTSLNMNGLDGDTKSIPLSATKAPESSIVHTEQNSELLSKGTESRGVSDAVIPTHRVPKKKSSDGKGSPLKTVKQEITDENKNIDSSINYIHDSDQFIISSEYVSQNNINHAHEMVLYSKGGGIQSNQLSTMPFKTQQALVENDVMDLILLPEGIYGVKATSKVPTYSRPPELIDSSVNINIEQRGLINTGVEDKFIQQNSTLEQSDPSLLVDKTLVPNPHQIIEKNSQSKELLTWDTIRSLAKGLDIDLSQMWKIYKLDNGLTKNYMSKVSNRLQLVGRNPSILNKHVWEGMINRGLKRDGLIPEAGHDAVQGAVRYVDEVDDNWNVTGDKIFIFYDETAREWYRLDSEAQLGHIVDAVKYWNDEGRKYGPLSPEVRAWMNDLDNYVFEYWETNAQRGARFSEAYLPPLKDN